LEPRELPDQPDTEAILEPQEMPTETQVNLEPRELPDYPELQTNLGNSVAEFNPNEILCDPALRKQIYEYAPEIQDQVHICIEQ